MTSGICSYNFNTVLTKLFQPTSSFTEISQDISAVFIDRESLWTSIDSLNFYFSIYKSDLYRIRITVNILNSDIDLSKDSNPPWLLKANIALESRNKKKKWAVSGYDGKSPHWKRCKTV